MGVTNIIAVFDFANYARRFQVASNVIVIFSLEINYLTWF